MVKTFYTPPTRPMKSVEMKLQFETELYLDVCEKIDILSGD